MVPQKLDGKIALHPAEALVRLGYSRDLEAAKKTARNLICLGKFPLPLQLILGKQRVLVADVLTAAGLGALPSQALLQPQPTIEKRGPGRPRKSLQTTIKT